MEHNNTLAGAVVIALLVGAGIGYYIGLQRGSGTVALEPEVDEEALADEIASSANPFAQTSANPVSSGYVNPFKTSTANPFAQ